MGATIPVFVAPKRRLFTVDDYHQMAAAGLFAEDDRLELLDGEVFEMSPIGRRHAACVDRLTRALVTATGDAAIVRVQNPIALDARSEPLPDIAILRPRDDFYASAHPGPEDIWLVIEVGETSSDFDRDVKLPRYARAGVREVWLIDLAERRIHVYREPAAEGYRVQHTVGPDGLLPVPGSARQLPARDLLVD